MPIRAESARANGPRGYNISQGKLIGYGTPRPFGTQPLPVYPLHGSSTPVRAGLIPLPFFWCWSGNLVPNHRRSTEDGEEAVPSFRVSRSVTNALFISWNALTEMLH